MLNSLGLALARLDRLPEAIERYQSALRINAGLHEVHNNLGVALARSNRMTEAIQEFQQALRLKPDFDGARGNLRKAQEARHEVTSTP